MSLMKGTEYIESPRKLNLQVYMFGKKVENPVDDPILRPSINSIRMTYDLAQMPEYEDLMTAISPETGKRINRFMHIHRSAGDLVKKIKMQRLLGQQTAACFQRCVGMDGANAVYSTTYEVDQACGTKYHENFKENKGFSIAMETLDGGRIGIAAQALGLGEGAIDETIQYTRERTQFGRRLSQFQNTQFQLADMKARADAAQLLVYRAAAAKDLHDPDVTLYASIAKLFASEMAASITRRAVQLFGGYGYIRDFPVERMMRDAKITEIYEGTSEVQRMVIANRLGLK